MAENKKIRKKKVRVRLRSNIQKQARHGSSQWTRRHREDELTEKDSVSREAVKAKGRLARRRTVDVHRAGGLLDPQSPTDRESAGPEEQWVRGVVVRVHGHFAKVDDGQTVRNCVQRRVLKSLLLDQRGAIAVGDEVDFTPIDDEEGVIERVQPRERVLIRRYRNKEHIIVSNVDQVVIVSSVAKPHVRIHLVDRYLVAALVGDLQPVLVFNKIDLPHEQPLEDYRQVYEKLGYRTLLASAVTGEGIDGLREVLASKKTVLAGLSGVGKSSLLNALQPGLKLTVRPVNRSTGRGQHTTTTVSLLKLNVGGYVVDTPGIRQFALWRLRQQDLASYFEEFLPYLDQCKFPNCTHIHEDRCAVKDAVAAGDVAAWRYESYTRIHDDEEFTQPWQH